MKVLVIPDVHLKPWIFDEAEKVMTATKANMAVILGDLVDDWDCMEQVDKYEETIKRCLAFRHNFPNTKYCYGNHELAYLLNRECSGNCRQLRYVVYQLVRDMVDQFGEDAKLIHKIDNVLFSHAGLTSAWYDRIVAHRLYDHEGLAWVSELNNISDFVWMDASPVWVRAQHQDKFSKLDRIWMWHSGEYLQVVGHTPVEHILQEGTLITCDTFSTYSNGDPIGDQTFLLIDTEKQTWEAVVTNHD